MKPISRVVGRKKRSAGRQPTPPPPGLPAKLPLSPFAQPGKEVPPPDIEAILRTADDQAQSRLFQLPQELRDAIFQHAWEDAGLCQHVFRWTSMEPNVYSHMRCVCDHTAAEDERQVELERFHTGELQAPADPAAKEQWEREWFGRLKCKWSNHWMCREAVMAHPLASRRWTPFLPLLLTCRRSYAENRDRMYKSITLTFTDLETALHLLVDQRPAWVDSLTTLHLSVNVPGYEFCGFFEGIPHPASYDPDGLRWLKFAEAVAGFKDIECVQVWFEQWFQDRSYYSFPQRFASVLTVSVPAEPSDSLAHEEDDKLPFGVLKRGWAKWRSGHANPGHAISVVRMDRESGFGLAFDGPTPVGRRYEPTLIRDVLPWSVLHGYARHLAGSGTSQY